MAKSLYRIIQTPNAFIGNSSADVSFNLLTWKKIARALVVGNLSAWAPWDFQAEFSCRVLLIFPVHNGCVSLVSDLIFQNSPQSWSFQRNIGEEQRSFHLWQISQTLQSWHPAESKQKVGKGIRTFHFLQACFTFHLGVCEDFVSFCSGPKHTRTLVTLRGISVYQCIIDSSWIQTGFTCKTQRKNMRVEGQIAPLRSISSLNTCLD